MTMASARPTDQHTDQGYSFAEMLVAVVLIGLLATIVTAAVRNVTTEAASAGCEREVDLLDTAVTSYFALSKLGEIVPTGDGIDRYERTLVDSGHLRTPSINYDVHVDGSITPQEDSLC